MTNIIQIDKSRGFTRMDNQMMDALAAIHLSPSEFKTLHAITRMVVGYQIESRRITAEEVAKKTNILPAHASRAISSLLARRVLYRVGGSRGDIGICNPAEWIYQEPKKEESTRSKSVEITKIGSLAPVTKLPISDDSLLYTKKETPIPLPTEEGMSPQAETAPAKAERKAPFGKTQMLADNPHGLDESLIADYLAVRKAKRAPMTARVWATLNEKLTKCLGFGITPAQAIAIAIDNGWQGFEVEWIVNRSAKTTSAAKTASQSRHTGFSDRDYSRGLIDLGDGEHAF